MTDQPTPASLLSLLGGFPARPSLDPVTIATNRTDDSTESLVSYTTLSGERVEALLLVPHRPRVHPTPAVIAVHQDGDRRPYTVGKSEVAGRAGDPSLAYGRELCQRSYVVICPDRFGFESRRLARSAHAAQFAAFPIQSTTTGTDLTEDLFKGAVANRLLFSGWTSLGKEFFELSRTVDYLSEVTPTVDPGRIGVIGHSAGGHIVPYLMFVDDRVKVGCASCGTWFFAHAFRADHLRPMQGFGSFMTVPGMADWGDTDDVLAGIAPRPYWEHRGDFGDDFGAADLIRKAEQRYAHLGMSERFRFREHQAGHVFPQLLREEAYQWFDRWL